MIHDTLKINLTLLAEKADLDSTVKMVFTDGPTFYIKSCSKNSLVSENILDDVKVTFTLSLEDLDKMLKSQLNPTVAFMEGKMTIQGDMSTAMKLAQAMS